MIRTTKPNLLTIKVLIIREERTRIEESRRVQQLTRETRRLLMRKKSSGAGVSTPLRCFKCSEFGHRILECKSETSNYFKCGKPWHKATDRKSKGVT